MFRTRRTAYTFQDASTQGVAKRARRTAIHCAGFCLVLLGLPGCMRELDMAKTYDDRQAETTIRYTGVRGSTRQYADYSGIQGTILTEPAKTER